MFSGFFFNRAVGEIMWKIIVKRDRPQMTVRCMRIHAGYVRLQIHTLRLCNTHCFSTATMVARTRLNVTLYFFACLIYLYFEIKKDFAEIIEKMA